MPPVSHIRLRLEERQAATPCRYREPTDPIGTSRLFPLLRLTALVLIKSRTGSSGSRPENALIDTGAWITAIETDTWQAFDRAGLIEHLPFADGVAPTPALIGGHESPYQLGRLWMALIDLQPTAINWLPAVPVIAQLLLNKACRLPTPILLGLHLGVLDGRKLTREVVPMEPAAMTTDRGSQYGQQWYLESV